MPEKMIDILTSNIVRSVHTLINLTFSFKFDFIATLEYYKCLRLKKNYIRVVTVTLLGSDYYASYKLR